jgi:hypothetical protein
MDSARTIVNISAVGLIVFLLLLSREMALSVPFFAACA